MQEFVLAHSFCFAGHSQMKLPHGIKHDKKEQLYFKKESWPAFFYQFPCWLFQHACDIKGVCHVQLVHQFSLDSRINKPPKFSESFCPLMQIIKLE